MSASDDVKGILYSREVDSWVIRIFLSYQLLYITLKTLVPAINKTISKFFSYNSIEKNVCVSAITLNKQAIKLIKV